MSELKKGFEEELAPVEWSLLRPHMERGALILVSPKMSIVNVAVAVAEDDAEKVGKWIESGKLSKPDQEQLDKWNAAPKTLLNMLIVQPYVLAQEVVD